MALWDDVQRLALALPEVTEGTRWGLRSWLVRGKGFVWERPLRPGDLAALGAAAPTGPILGAQVEHLGAKEALLAERPDLYFTTPHFDGYAAVLVRLEAIPEPELADLVVDAWLARAPRRLAAAYLDSRQSTERGA